MKKYWNLFFTMLKIGLFTFGGGYAMIPFIQETVLKHGWLTTAELVDFIAVSESTPGAFAVNISTYVGSQVGGFFGAVCATAGIVLPAFIVILIIAKIYDKFKSSKTVKGAMFGLKSVVVGLIAATVISIATEVFFINGFSFSVFTTANFWFSLVIFAVMLFLLLYKKFSPILIVVLSATIGIVAGYAGLIQV